jgi:hypothetical protein
MLERPRANMSASEAKTCEAGYRREVARNLGIVSEVEAAAENAEKEAKEFVDENANDYRALKVGGQLSASLHHFSWCLLDLNGF